MRRIVVVGCVVVGLLLAPGGAGAKGKPEHAGKPPHAGGPSKDKGEDKGPPPGVKMQVLRDVDVVGGGPPPWAPAHGYRRKHGGGGGEVLRYETPYGIGSGFCKRDAIAAAIGGAGGGVVGGVLSDGDTTAIVGGILAGALLGTILSKTGDPVDRGCFGQALEHGRSNQPVSWKNPKSGASYRFVPLRTFETDGGRYCREYTNVVIVGGRERTEHGTACRDAEGIWH